MDLTNLKELLTEDDAVSPVIGVILMVAITVILAAVIASFVLGLGDQAQQTTPQASFSFDYNEVDSDGDGYVTVTHDGGDAIEAQELFVRGSGINGNNDAPAGSTPIKSAGAWTNAGFGSSSEISAGQSAYVEVNSDYDIRIIYEPVEGDTSATLAQDTGPDA